MTNCLPRRTGDRAWWEFFCCAGRSDHCGFEGGCPHAPRIPSAYKPQNPPVQAFTPAKANVWLGGWGARTRVRIGRRGLRSHSRQRPPIPVDVCRKAFCSPDRRCGVRKNSFQIVDLAKMSLAGGKRCARRRGRAPGLPIPCREKGFFSFSRQAVDPGAWRYMVKKGFLFTAGRESGRPVWGHGLGGTVWLGGHCRQNGFFPSDGIPRAFMGMSAPAKPKRWGMMAHCRQNGFFPFHGRAAERPVLGTARLRDGTDRTEPNMLFASEKKPALACNMPCPACIRW